MQNVKYNFNNLVSNQKFLILQFFDEAKIRKIKTIKNRAFQEFTNKFQFLLDGEGKSLKLELTYIYSDSIMNGLMLEIIKLKSLKKLIIEISPTCFLSVAKLFQIILKELTALTDFQIQNTLISGNINMAEFSFFDKFDFDNLIDLNINLKYFSIKNFNLESKSFFKKLSELTEINSLSIINCKIPNQNQLELIGAFYCLQNLQTLIFEDLDLTGLSSIFKSISDHSKIKKLSIISCNLPQFSDDLVFAFSRMINLEELNLSGISSSNTGFNNLINKIGELINIFDLRLNDNNLNDENIVELSKTLLFLKNLKYLSLRNNAFTNIGFSTISKIIRTRNLFHLNISDNKFDSQLEDLIDKNESSLVYLNISKLNIKNDITFKLNENMKGLKFLQKLNLMKTNLSNSIGLIPFKFMPHLDYLNIGYCKLGLNGCIELSNQLEYLKGLSYLNIQSNDINDKAIEHLANNFYYLKNLTHLNANRGRYGESKNTLFKNFQTLQRVTFLDLSDICLFENGCKYLSNYLADLKGLTYLDISSNKLGFTGIKYLESSLISLSELTYLNLNYNDLDVQGAVILKKILPYLNRLRSLNLRNNLFKNEGIDYILESLSTLRHLNYLNFCWNSADEDKYYLGFEILKDNFNLKIQIDEY